MTYSKDALDLLVTLVGVKRVGPIIEHVNVGANDNVILNFDRRPRPNAGAGVDIASLPDLDLTAMGEHEQFPEHHRIATDSDVIALAARVKDFGF